MKIVHLSYVRIKERDPDRWLHQINFFSGVVEKMTRFGDVSSIHSIDYTGTRSKDGASYYFFKRSYIDSLFPFKLHSKIRELQPDVVIVHGLGFPWQVIQLQRSLGKSVKLFLQNHAEKPLRFYKKYLQKIADRRIDGYFFSSFDLSKPWLEKGQIKSSAKIHSVMEVSSPFHPIGQNQAREKTEIKSKKSYLWVGRLDKNKDPITLTLAFIKFLEIEKDAMLYIIFQGNELLPTLQQLLESYPLEKRQIILVGKVDHEDLIYWYNSVNFIISTSHYEGSGVAICEGMSCGCIPIVSDIPSFRMMTNDGMCGLLFKPGNANELAKKLAESLTLNISSQRSKVLYQFHANLSYEAIATMIYQVITG